MKLVMHSYSFRNYPIEHVFAVARHFGFPAVELASCHFDAAEARRDLAAAVRLGRRFGVHIHCAGYYGDFIADGAVRTRSIELVRAVIDACADNGIDLVNGFGGWLVRDEPDWRRNGSAMAGEREYERAAAAYRMLCEYAAERGVRVSVEVHPNTVHDTIEAALRLRDLVGGDSLIITPDPANSYILSEPDRDPGILDRLGQVPYFHLKNCRPADPCPDFTVGTADGAIDNHRWLEKLSLLKVPAVCLEYCGSGDPHPPIAAAREYVHDCLRLGEALRDHGRGSS
ncbi:sugar phosphate isomerase/epimerase family protein [Actinoallomurus rhizosphaericola]|uniref:sugar phosphate isomerase/epimerase family protein n=1 Tax=Actinoallomurus rhizosphaericola TaxID=2952536 RepID=UPI0020924C0D|nr:sugar phosphate isomerase/epimerase family protein [Actinoallomurus rhizosphaericola]MCO5998088.1 sugar phosphate isomerase/epimerase [Actinoallomurus rhizosphaericola]